MKTHVLLFVLAILCAVWAVVSAIRITHFLKHHEIKTPFPFIGLMLFRNIALYKKITLKETGKTGGLFYSYILAINAALIFTLAGVVNTWISLI